MTERNTERDTFISKAVQRASREIGDMRACGEFVCDIAYIQGTMIEAARDYDRRAENRT
jgi:hypothetical protein